MQLKECYSEVVGAHQTLKAQYISLQEERDTVEQQYQHLCDGWRVELESKQAAFEETRKQIMSQRCLVNYVLWGLPAFL
jgi:hypothetical protein